MGKGDEMKRGAINGKIIIFINDFQETLVFAESNPRTSLDI